MTSYEIRKLGVSEAQLDELMAGKKIRLDKDQFQGDVILPLTKAQAKSVDTATRAITLKFSSRQIKEIHTGEGWLTDKLKKLGRWALPHLRTALHMGLDRLQKEVPTELAGPNKNAADKALAVARFAANHGIDVGYNKLMKMLGGELFKAKLDAVEGAGFFDEKLGPALQGVLKIAEPIYRKGGDWAEVQAKMAEVHGKNWFVQYLKPGLDAAARVSVPMLRGAGFRAHHKELGTVAPAKGLDGETWLSTWALPQALPREVEGSGVDDEYEPMCAPKEQKKRTSAKGLVL